MGEGTNVPLPNAGERTTPPEPALACDTCGKGCTCVGEDRAVVGSSCHWWASTGSEDECPGHYVATHPKASIEPVLAYELTHAEIAAAAPIANTSPLKGGSLAAHGLAGRAEDEGEAQRLRERTWNEGWDACESHYAQVWDGGRMEEYMGRPPAAQRPAAPLLAWASAKLGHVDENRRVAKWIAQVREHAIECGGITTDEAVRWLGELHDLWLSVLAEYQHEAFNAGAASDTDTLIAIARHVTDAEQSGDWEEAVKRIALKVERAGVSLPDHETE